MKKLRVSMKEDVIYTTETWDTTTIRASVGQYLVSKYIGEKSLTISFSKDNIGLKI